MVNEKRLIDAMDTVIKISKAVTPLVNSGCSDEWVCQRIYDKVLNCIAVAPTVDAVEVVHGRWEEATEQDEEFGEIDSFKCSVCSKLSWFEANYCPNCGADMR